MMTETLEIPETQPDGLGPVLERWAEEPPPSITGALGELGVDPEALENHVRTGSPEEVENLRRVLVAAAARDVQEDASLLARLTPLLDPRERAWDRVLRARSTGEVLSATVTEAVKGGLVVDLGVRGFIPSSQIGLSVPRNLHQFVGQTIRFRVLEVDRRRQTVILSNRQVAEEERAAKRKAALGRLEDGEIRKGIVRRLTDIGAFVDVGGVDGLLHVSEISWKRVEHPSDVLKVGQKIQVKVLRVDAGAGRISLSMRQLMADPWEEARRKFPVGSTHQVRIAQTVQQGALVDLEEGLEGFIPISEMASRRINSPEEAVQVGQEVEAVVIDLRPREHRIVFSLRKLEQKRDRQVVETYQKKQTSRSDRTTLGDLFGHLFEEYQTEEPAAAATAGATEEPGDAATRGHGDTETAGRGEGETSRLGDAATRAGEDAETRGRGDTGTPVAGEVAAAPEAGLAVIEAPETVAAAEDEPGTVDAAVVDAASAEALEAGETDVVAPEAEIAAAAEEPVRVAALEESPVSTGTTDAVALSEETGGSEAGTAEPEALATTGEEAGAEAAAEETAGMARAPEVDAPPALDPALGDEESSGSAESEGAAPEPVAAAPSKRRRKTEQQS